MKSEDNPKFEVGTVLYTNSYCLETLSFSVPVDTQELLKRRVGVVQFGVQSLKLVVSQLLFIFL
jgi:hypothetical protein